jgi:RHS repeat-associated protein
VAAVSRVDVPRGRRRGRRRGAVVEVAGVRDQGRLRRGPGDRAGRRRLRGHDHLGGQVQQIRRRAGIGIVGGLRAGVLARVATRRYYDPYGNPAGTAPPGWPGTKGFVGGTADPATGLTNLGAREYNPATGSFISPDQLITPGDPQNLNAYAYAADDPASDADPSGLRPTGPNNCPCLSTPPGPAPGPAPARQPASQPPFTAQASGSCGIMCGNPARELGLLGPVTTPVRTHAVRQASTGITESQGILSRLTNEGRMLGGVAIPLGFSSLAQYLRFANTLNEGLSSYPQARAYFRGSSVTGSSYTKGIPFDENPKGPSDYDLAISGDDVFQAAKEAGVGLRQGGIRTGPLDEEQEQELGLNGVMTELRQMTGRKVSAMIYQDEPAVASRPGAYIPVPNESEVNVLDPGIVEPDNIAADEGLVDLIFDSGDDGE